MSTTLPDGTVQKTGAIRIMINMVQKLLKDVPCTYAACVFDAKGPTFRDALYPEYKAQRSPMPDDLRSQIAPIHEVVRLLGLAGAGRARRGGRRRDRHPGRDSRAPGH